MSLERMRMVCGETAPVRVTAPSMAAATSEVGSASTTAAMAS